MAWIVWITQSNATRTHQFPRGSLETKFIIVANGKGAPFDCQQHSTLRGGSHFGEAN